MYLPRRHNKLQKRRNNSISATMYERVQGYIKLLKQTFTQIWIWMVRKDAFIYILFVGLAFLFWWGRAMSSQRELTIKLPVEYTHVPAQVVFENQLPTSLEVTLRDNGRLLRQIQHTKPNIQIAIEDKLKDSTGVMLLPTDMIRPKVQDILPGSTVIQQIYPEEITSAFHMEATKCVPISLCAQWTLEEQYQLVAPPMLTPSMIDIYGTQQAIDTIDAILTDSLLVENIVDTKQIEVGLIIPKGIRTQVATTTVVWTAEQFTDKSFTIPIEVEGAVAGEVIHLFPNTTTVTVRVGISHFTQVSAEDLRVVCEYPTHTHNALPVRIEYNNPYITLARSSIREVEYIIER